MEKDGATPTASPEDAERDRPLLSDVPSDWLRERLFVSEAEVVSDVLSVLATELLTECDVPKDSEREVLLDTPWATLVESVSDSDFVVPLPCEVDDILVSDQPDIAVLDTPSLYPALIPADAITTEPLRFAPTFHPDDSVCDEPPLVDEDDPEVDDEVELWATPLL